MFSKNTPPPNQPDEMDDDPAQQDAKAMRRWYPLSFLLKLLILLAIVLVLCLIVFFYVAGTEGGTKFLLEKVAEETGVQFSYGKGNLRDGIWITDIDINATEDIEVIIDKAYVKIGWRALFAREVHLRDVDINRVDIVNKAPPTGEPFDYTTLQLPVNLRFDQAKVNTIVYDQVGSDPVRISGLVAEDLQWVDTTVSIDEGRLQYSDIVNIKELSGEITLEGDYALDADAVVSVSALEQNYVGDLVVSAGGTLKRTVGEVRSRYNENDVRGEFTIQGMDDDAPFSAKLTWDHVLLPYAESQNITLDSGTLTASGVLSNIELRINAELDAKDIPSGHYQGRGIIADSQLRIEHLAANVPEGDVRIQGVLDWSQAFEARLMAYSRNFDLQQAVPEEYADFSAYAPETLDGELAFVFQNENASGNMQMDIDLDQRDGEHLYAKLVQGKTSAKSSQEAPWYINAAWEQLRRQNIPDIGNIDSPSGQADVIVQGSRMRVTADARINELNAAPQGDYHVALLKNNNNIDINELTYQGVVGDLSAMGQVTLATESKPLSWQITANTNGLLLQNYQADLPVERLVGNLSANGQMTTTGQGDNAGQRHTFSITDSDLQLTLDESQGNRQISINGAGDGDVALVAGEIEQFDARFNGELAADDLPSGNLNVDVGGTLDEINIRQLRYGGEAGSLDAKGQVSLGDAIGWDIQATLDAFNLGYFLPDNPAVVSGELDTSGRWKNAATDKQSGQLMAFDIDFDGTLDTEQLPSGRLSIDAGGDSQLITIRRFSHVGDAGSINATGTLDVRNGVAWDINANMDRFNVGYFMPDMPSSITGNVVTNGQWQTNSQSISITQMNLTGTLRDQPLNATGTLDAQLRLPSDLQAYVAQLQGQNPESQYQQVNALVERLDANNLVVSWGDNYITANGNASNLQANVNITSLDQLSPTLSGEVSGGATLIQPVGQALPTIYVDLVGERISLPNMLLMQGRIKGKVVNLANSPSKLVVTAEGLQLGTRSFKDLNVVFDGTEQSHVVDLSLANEQISISGILKGGFDREQMRWSGVIGKGEAETEYVNLTQLQPAQVVADIDDQSIQLAAHCWQAADESGKVCLREPLIASSEQGQVDLTLQNLDTSLFSAFLPDDINWQAKINGKAIVGWQQGQAPSVNATLYSDNGKIGLIQEDGGQQLDFPYQRISLIALSVEEGLKLRMDVNTGRGGRGYAEVVVDPYETPKPISGALVFNNLDLAVFKPFFPGMRTLDGQLSLAGGLGGTLQAPQFYGNFNLADGSIAMLDLPVNLSDVNVSAQIRGQNANIDGRFNSGDGEGTLTGTVNWEQELQAKLSLEGENLVITQPPLLSAQINPDIDVIVRPLDRYVNIEGAVSVPQATIRPPEASEDIVTQSDDVVVFDRRMIGNIEEVLAISEPWSINADIGVDLGDDVSFRGFGAVLPLAGAVNITQQGQGTMMVRGMVQVSRRTNVDAFGQSLELNYAQVRFNGGDVMNPNLSIEAAKEIEGSTVGVRVKGASSDPNIVVYNDAGLTQQQAMNALVTGRISNSGTTQISEQGFKSEVSNNLAAAGLGYGLSGTRNLTNQIGEAFGLQSLTVDASGSEDDTNVNVTGYITPDLYIRYGVGVFNAESTLSMRYQLTRRVYLEAIAETENIIDVVYSWQF